MIYCGGQLRSSWDYDFHFDWLIGRVAYYTGKKNAQFIVQEWIFESSSSLLSTHKYVELKINRFEIEKRPREIFINDIQPLGFVKGNKILTV